MRREYPDPLHVLQRINPVKPQKTNPWHELWTVQWLNEGCSKYIQAQGPHSKKKNPISNARISPVTQRKGFMIWQNYLLLCKRDNQLILFPSSFCRLHRTHILFLLVQKHQNVQEPMGLQQNHAACGNKDFLTYQKGQTDIIAKPEHVHWRQSGNGWLTSSIHFNNCWLWGRMRALCWQLSAREETKRTISSTFRARHWVTLQCVPVNSVTKDYPLQMITLRTNYLHEERDAQVNSADEP